MGAEDVRITAGNLQPGAVDADELFARLKRDVPSLEGVQFMISIAVMYGNPAEQERAETVVAEQLDELNPEGKYERTINSGDGSDGVASERTDRSI